MVRETRTVAFRLAVSRLRGPEQQMIGERYLERVKEVGRGIGPLDEKIKTSRDFYLALQNWMGVSGCKFHRVFCQSLELSRYLK